MFSLTGFKKAFTPVFGLSLLALIVVILFMRLGFWQISRSLEKKNMIAQRITRANQLLAWHPGESMPAQYQSVQLEGTYLSHHLLLDNQHHQHQLGFNVITPLVLPDKKVVLIDRGWLPRQHSRQELPAVSTPQTHLNIQGYVYYPSDKKITLGQMIEQSQGNKTVIEWLDTQDIGHFLHYSVYPFIIRLNKDQPHGFVRDWKVVSMPPERHLAYAVQWFAMALAVAVIWLVLIIKNDHANKS